MKWDQTGDQKRIFPLSPYPLGHTVYAAQDGQRAGPISERGLFGDRGLGKH